MNESTLVPREEMSDFDWLARNVHVWAEDWTHVRKCPVHHEAKWMASLSPNAEYKDWRTKQQWLARRAELQNKPRWKDAPEWAVCIVQDRLGNWYFCSDTPNNDGGEWSDEYVRKSLIANGGVVLGDWRDTLEKRPEGNARSMSGVHSNGDMEKLLDELNDIDESIFGDGFIPKDAATAKQSAPNGSGNPILGMVLADLANRALEGKEKYGEPLLANNGRNPLWDAYQEALDLAMYLRQAIEEQKQ